MTSTLSRVLPAWQQAAAVEGEDREAAEAAADKLCRRQLLSKACCGWQEEMQVLQAQRQGLWRLMLTLLSHERKQLLREAVQAWRGWVQDHVSLRACIATFVNKRRLACLSDFLNLWQQYAAAMRGGQADKAAAATVLLQQALTPPPPRARSPSAVSPSPAADHTWPNAARVSSPAASVPAFNRAASPGASPSVYASSVRPTSPPGLLPVTAGPGSPLLGPRSAQQDRRLARRWAAMGGGAPEVNGLCVFKTRCL